LQHEKIKFGVEHVVDVTKVGYHVTLVDFVGEFQSVFGYNGLSAGNTRFAKGHPDQAVFADFAVYFEGIVVLANGGICCNS
jgi:hypothetical protein